MFDACVQILQIIAFYIMHFEHPQILLFSEGITFPWSQSLMGSESQVASHIGSKSFSIQI